MGKLGHYWLKNHTWVSPDFFRKLGKIPQILGKNVLIAVISRLNFPFKMHFSRVSRRKIQRFLLTGSVFLLLQMIVYLTVPLFQENSTALKNSWLRAWSSSNFSVKLIYSGILAFVCLDKSMPINANNTSDNTNNLINLLKFSDHFLTFQ